ncbi:CPBP family intramembrane glutamic endopeptidase [Maridesulfovibrio ferrireducens]|uniref:CPBP family intramembrane glutamic endopeptidase n=1 Tax=Maridesulfovibrio ferrireducens TaxID=246191 RepID=UPI001A21171B|nr:type II CAAX endopeptidase family protein [Maridesulfovibrio ferrireducens]MBI9113094.1 CPBP family intramembrane metalloprotease [Maridesulfovibrio ferrireducens]
MDKSLLKQLDAIISSVIRGDYSHSVEMDRMQDNKKYTQDEVRFLESLGFMSVKLEAREFVLEKTIEGLKSRNAELLEEKKKNNLFSNIFVSLFLSVSLYIFLIFLADKLNYENKNSARIVEAIFLMVSIFIIRKSGFSFSSLGVTLDGAVESIRRMLPGTLAACGSLLLLKVFFIMFWAKEIGGELFVMDNFNLILLVYLPVAALQEFIARGVIQTTIESVLDKPYATLQAILTASALFGLVHIQLSVGIAFASFVCSLYWGYLYTQKRCLVGVSISHFMIGGLAYVLGFWDYLYII